MPELDRPGPLRAVATGATALFAAVFLIVGIASLLTNNGLFSAGIAAMLLMYGALLTAIAWGCWRGNRWANGAVVASNLLHLLVSISMARGSHQPAIHLFAVLALVGMVAGGRIHLDDLRDTTD